MKFSTPTNTPITLLQSVSLRSAVSAIALASAVCGVANAQDADAEEADDEEDRVVVTALRRETNIEDTPLPITAFGGENLEDIGADGLEAFLQFAPGVQFDRGANGQNSVFIRGLTAAIGNTPVGFYLDEVPFTGLSTTATPDVRSWDLERVEVLRGPQGTLYGASSLGGTIRILTKDPVHNEFQAKGDFFYSNTERGGGDNYGVKGAVNVPLVEDRLTLRLAATQEEYSGWIDQQDFFTFGPTREDINNYDVWTARAKLRYTVSDNAEVVLSYWHNESNSGGGNVSDDAGGSNNLLNPASGSELVSKLFGAEITIDFDNFATLTSSTSYLDYFVNIPFTDFPPFFTDGSTEIFNQEVRLVSNTDGPLLWTLGAIFTTNENIGTTLFVAPPTLVLDTTQRIDGRSFAIYGEVTYSISDTLDATAGLRYFNDELDRNDTNLGVDLTPFTNKFDDISPRFNLAWRPKEDALLFATVSKGFRSGLTQAAVSLAAAEFVGVSLPQEIDPEKAWNYEIGTKLSFLEGQLNLDVVGYYIDYSNIQTQLSLDPFVFGTINTGSVDAYGVEFATFYEAADNLFLSVAGNWNNTEYAETITDAFGLTAVNEGERVAGTPELTIAGSIDYSHDLGGDWRAVGRASVEHNSSRSAFGFNALAFDFEPVFGDQNTRVNLRAGIENDVVGIYGFAENLNDDDNAINPDGDNPAFATRYRPRTIGVNVKVKF